MQITIDDRNIQAIATAIGLHGKVKTDDTQEILKAWIGEAIAEKFKRDSKVSNRPADTGRFVSIGLMIYEYLKNESQESYKRIESTQIEEMIPEMPEPLQSILNWKNAVGTCLGHLAKSHPELIKKGRTTTKRFWDFTF